MYHPKSCKKYHTIRCEATEVFNALYLIVKVCLSTEIFITWTNDREIPRQRLEIYLIRVEVLVCLPHRRLLYDGTGRCKKSGTGFFGWQKSKYFRNIWGFYNIFFLKNNVLWRMDLNIVYHNTSLWPISFFINTFEPFLKSQKIMIIKFRIHYRQLTFQQPRNSSPFHILLIYLIFSF